MSSSNLTYISLFSSAGIGCYRLKELNFNCIATAELIEKRLEIQKGQRYLGLDHNAILLKIKSGINTHIERLEVSFLLNKNGDLVIALNAPHIFKESLKNLQDYWNVTQK